MIDFDCLTKILLTMLLEYFNVECKIQDEHNMIYVLNKTIPDVMIEQGIEITKERINEYLKERMAIFRHFMWKNTSNIINNEISFDNDLEKQKIIHDFDYNNIVGKIARSAEEIIDEYKSDFMRKTNEQIVWTCSKLSSNYDISHDSMLITCLYHNINIILKECLKKMINTYFTHELIHNIIK
jgi:hypothetical protein